MTEHVISQNIKNVGMLVGNVMTDEWNGIRYGADLPSDG